MSKLKVSVIIPVYNEEKVITNCLKSLELQKDINFEVIVVDDGSTDKTLSVVKDIKLNYPLKILEQDHKGPGAARNLGASVANGNILVFVDSDMEFSPKFLYNLILPIEKGEVIGTFSKEEYLLNKDNLWARFWNLNLGRHAEKMHADNYPDTQEVFRAILKDEFLKINGFDTDIGYTDDWSLSRKLRVQATFAPNAIYFHRNPENLSEVWSQARWFGKNEFLTKNIYRRIYNIIKYSILFSIFNGISGSIKYKSIKFFVFKLVYDLAVTTSVVKSFINEGKNK